MLQAKSVRKALPVIAIVLAPALGGFAGCPAEIVAGKVAEFVLMPVVGGLSRSPPVEPSTDSQEMPVLGGLLVKGLGPLHRQHALWAIEETLKNAPDGQARQWDAGLGNGGTVVVVRTYTAQDGRVCKKYLITVIDPNGERSAHDTACRDPDGTWASYKSSG